MQHRDLTVHGSDGRDTTFQVDGMTLNGIEGDGSVQSYFNEMMFEEISYQTSAINAEVSAGGVRANMIPKDGGNVFKGTAFFSAANKSLQSDNSADARKAGLAAPDALNKVWDFNLAEGGPIKRDRLWFFASYRDWGVYQYIANSFFANGDQTVDDASTRSGVVRLTTGGLRDCRRSDRHPRTQAVLHDRRQVHRDADQPAAPRSRYRNQQRELFVDARRRVVEQHSASRYDAPDGIQRLRRRRLLP